VYFDTIEGKVMDREEKVLDLFVQVLDSLTRSDQRSFSVRPGWRDELERLLSLAMADGEYRGMYQHALLKFRVRHLHDMPCSVQPEDVPTDQIYQTGWSVLDDQSLAQLSLDLMAIEPLALRYEQALEAGCLGESWTEVLTWATPEELANEPAETLHVYQRLQQLLSEVDDAKENREISDLESEQIVQAFAIRKDRELVALQHTRLFAQVRKQLHLLESLYRDMENCPTTQSTTEFTKLYIRFHSVLAAVGPHQSVVEQACEFIRNHESQHPLTEDRKTRVLVEHRQLLDAILAGDAFGASDAMIGHLTNSEQRWLPEFHDSLSEGNASIFREMQEDSFLCVSSVNVLPIESEAREWPSLGMAAADAVARGATLLYLTPAPEILRKHLGDSDVSAPWQNELQVDFEDFIERISGHIQSVSPWRFVSQDEALSYVRSRVLLLTLFDDALFVRTQPDRTCGYFWFEPSSELLTERKPLLNDVTHRKIERINDLNNFENFKEYLAEALVMARSRLQADQESLLQRLDHVLSCLGTARHHELEPATTHG
jgi:DNA-binding FadR family transcriptional regulator